MRHTAPDGELELVPILRLVFLQFLVRAGHEIIAHLKLRFADEQSTVGIHGGAELKLEVKILRKLPRGGQLFQFARSPGMDNKNAIVGAVTRVAALGLAVKTVRLSVHAVGPAGEVLAV